MQMRWIIGTMCALMLTAFVTVRAEETEAPKKEQPKARMVQPWSKLSGLSDDQKVQIKAIHAKAMDEIKAIKDKEESDIMALLSDEQKLELKAAIEKDKAAKKEKAASEKKEAPAAQ